MPNPMNTVAGTITLDWNTIITDEFDFDSVESLSQDWKKTLYFFWETECSSSQDFIAESEAILWNFLSHDISLSSEDHIHLDPFDYEEGIYEVASFEWEQIQFWEIKKRFAESPEVISVRECEISARFWNKIIRVDFLY
jgi:hypothetical protein